MVCPKISSCSIAAIARRCARGWRSPICWKQIRERPKSGHVLRVSIFALRQWMHFDLIAPLEDEEVRPIRSILEPSDCLSQKRRDRQDINLAAIGCGRE